MDCGMRTLQPRTPVQEEKDAMYVHGLDPAQWSVVSRLNGNMVICRRSDHSVEAQIKMPR